MNTQTWEATGNRYVPRPGVHRPCGTEIESVNVVPEHVARGRSGCLWLNPLTYPGQGDVTLTERGANLVALGEGDRVRHRCPSRPEPCHTCKQPILILHREPGAEFLLAFLDPEPVDGGLVIVDASAVAWFDTRREYEWDGPRYRRHSHSRAERSAPRNRTVIGVTEWLT